jgi:hypothetical protein
MFAASKTGRAVGGGPGPTPTDPSFAYVPLLLNTTSTNGQNNQGTTTTNGFLDSSTNNFTITRNGTPTQGSITPYWPNGQWSNYFNGSTDYLTLPASSALTLTADFTIEFWVYSGAFASGASNPSLFNTSPASIFYESSGSNRGLCLFVGSAIITTATTVLPNNQWNHVVCVRSGSTVSMFVNGSRVGTNASFSSTADFSSAFVGRYFGSAAGYLNGYMSNLRVVKGAAVYDPTLTTLTVPTAPLGKTTGGTNPPTGTQTSLLTCQSNRFIDNSANPLAITVNGTPRVQAFQPFSPTASYTTALYGGSGYFNGSTDYLSAASNAALGVGSSDFTIETWVYFTDVTGFQTVFDARTAQPSQSPLVTLQNTSRFQYLWNGVSFVNFGPTTLSPFTWYHVAVVRSAGVHTGYVNGVSYSLSTTDAAGVASAPMIVGARTVGGAADYLKGYLSNFRIVKGTAVYTGTPFTPPTLAPLTTAGSTSAASYTDTTNVNTSFAASNTSLLLNMANAGIYDAAVQNNAITVGNAQVSIAQSKWSPSSVKFDGTGDFLRMVDAPVFDLGSSDFTIEAWVYTASSSSQMIYSRESPALVGILFQVSSGLTVGVNLSSNGSNYTSSGLILTGGSITASTWTYVAVTRVGSGTNNIKLFLGATPGGSATQVAQGTFSGSIYNASTLTPIIGARNTNGDGPFNGYIQDFRFTRGVGRTISTVPSAPFPTR